MTLFLLFLYACVGFGVGCTVRSLENKYRLPEDINLVVGIFWPGLIGMWFVLYLENMETTK